MKEHASNQHDHFDEHHVVHELKHYLPAQAPLKDFIHHNTLHAFQKSKFFAGVQQASEIFGYKVSLSLQEFRDRYEKKDISDDIVDKIIVERKGADQLGVWKEKLVHQYYNSETDPRIGSLRDNWKSVYNFDMDSMVHPFLFRLLCSFLDQGISVWHFPVNEKGFLSAIRKMERTSRRSIFRKKRAKELLLGTKCEIKDLLQILVGDESLFEHYLYDQQFGHQGWSGMVSTVENEPYTLLDPRKISLHDLIVLELLLEIDALDFVLGKKWQPLGEKITQHPTPLFAPIPYSELNDVMSLWQEAFEWSFFDQVLEGMKEERLIDKEIKHKSFQAVFCIDDRECSLRRYLEKLDENCETFGTPGFFGVEFYYQPQNGKFYTKSCPAPVNPKYLIKEIEATNRVERDYTFNKHSHTFVGGWLISQTLGFWTALQLVWNIFRPSMSPATASSLKHMDKFSKLTVENTNPEDREGGLQIGYNIDEMFTRVNNVLNSIGLVRDFADIVYFVGHGASSLNNPYYAAYDCGACSGRAGSVNARVFCFMANHPEVRARLAETGIVIPATTQFVGSLHDTTRDEIVFYDEADLTSANFEGHTKNEVIFDNALDFNAKERSRRFEYLRSKRTPAKVHEKVLDRSVSLFEPRPELNHATNALCIVGRRYLTRGLFLDRRSFLNSYDYRIDPEGKYLSNILNAAAPVCGGINLEYFFSRVDDQKLGAGTKLPHNVMGLFGVANGIDGDLRPGLPTQMTEVHDPLRLLIIVEHFPEVVLTSIQRNPATFEWFINEWVNLVVIQPETKQQFRFVDGAFVVYEPITKFLETIDDLTPLIESHADNFPVYLINQN
jgi:uncharacterized protein YbcC (UPF0753/DUF2309 family)